MRRTLVLVFLNGTSSLKDSMRSNYAFAYHLCFGGTRSKNLIERERPTEMRRLILILWLIAEIDILTGPSLLSLYGAALMLVYVAAGIARSHHVNIALALIILITALVVVWADNNPTELSRAFAASLVFAAFVPSAHLLRTVAETDPRVLRFKDRLAQASDETRPGWLLIGSNMLGSVLTIGAVAVLAPTFADVTENQQRREDAISTVAGTALALTWSPFFVAMAVISSFVSSVPLWVAMPLGLVLAMVGLGTALLVMRVPDPCGTTLRAVRALSGFLPLVGIAGGSVILLRFSGSFSTLQAACIAMPPLCCILIATRSSTAKEAARRVNNVFTVTYDRLDNIGAEVGMVALAFALGIILRDSPTVENLIAATGLGTLPPSFVIVFIPAVMIVTGMLSVHPIVSASLMLSIFSDRHEGLSDLALMGATLVGWSAAAMLSFSGLLLMMTTSLSEVSRGNLIMGRNALLAPTYAGISAILLILLNWILV